MIVDLLRRAAAAASIRAALGCGLWLATTAGHAQSVSGPRSPRPFAIVELFTSEGCSGCPPADAVLAEVAADARRSGAEVYALSFNVDY